MNKVLLFYKYIHIPNPKAVSEWQRTLCESLQLKGRILIAHEGINGTVSGSSEHIETYIQEMRKKSDFSDIDFKESTGQGELFPKLKVKVRDEVVRLGISPEELNTENTGTHLSPHEVNALIEKNKKLVILDARNTFESKIGKFQHAITPDIEHFRELPAFIDNNLELFQDKDVLMYCTGGIRCERASAYLKSKNIAQEVYQVKGGIHRYVEECPNGYFRGKNYVFDGRVSVKINDDILGACDICAEPCDDMTNCINAACNEHFIACKVCIQKYQNTCSADCLHLVLAQEVIVRTKPAKTAR